MLKSSFQRALGRGHNYEYLSLTFLLSITAGTFYLLGRWASSPIKTKGTKKRSTTDDKSKWWIRSTTNGDADADDGNYDVDGHDEDHVGTDTASCTVNVDGKDPNTSTNRHHRATLEDQFVQNATSSTNRTSGLLVQPVGMVRSVYRLCVGTPRQGLLAPHAKGYIQLHLPYDAVDELQHYSHIWIVFVFHLNTMSSTSTPKNPSTNRSTSHKWKTPCKIAPPALGGTKVGVLATRSPHRFNPIGLTLVQLDAIERDAVGNACTSASKARRGPASSTVVLHISGLDLVDGTPVLDIKPYVPHYDAPQSSRPVRVPEWVSQGLNTRRSVEFEPHAMEQLRDIVLSNPTSLDFYRATTNNGDATLQDVKDCIVEVLSMDVRSTYQTNKARKGQFQAQKSQRLSSYSTPQGNSTTNGTTKDSGAVTADTGNVNPVCTQQLDNLLISYIVQTPESTQREASQGSGAEDHICVTSIALLET